MVTTSRVLLMLSISYALVCCAGEEGKKPAHEDFSPKTLTAIARKVCAGQLVFANVAWSARRDGIERKDKGTPHEDTWIPVWVWPLEEMSRPAELPLKEFLKEGGRLKTDGDVVNISHQGKQMCLVIHQKVFSTHKPFDEEIRNSYSFKTLIEPYIDKEKE